MKLQHRYEGYNAASEYLKRIEERKELRLIRLEKVMIVGWVVGGLILAIIAR